MSNEHVLDNLGEPDAHRVREVSAMVAKDGPLSEEKLNEIRAAVKRYIKARGYTQGQVAHFRSWRAI
jgi:hypothetical protein